MGFEDAGDDGIEGGKVGGIGGAPKGGGKN